MNLQIFLSLYCVAALGFAYISQYVFGMEPCVLCLYQRVPYFVAIALLVLSFLLKGQKRLLLVALTGATLFAGAGVALYHVGVEQKVITMEEECGDTAEAVDNLEAMRRQLLGKSYVPCDKPQFVFLSVSMAGWNFFFSLLVSWYTLLVCVKHYQRQRYQKLSDTFHASRKGDSAKNDEEEGAHE